jgi:hypothetical protein
MIGNQGIDADVSARMDAYRGNPQALMQRYQQNQQLIDLLALQKLKSEKEAAAREMQMQMAQQQQAQGGLPTIAQQREQEVMQMTKDELAKQTGATLGQKQATAQRNMQGIAQAASRPGARPMPNPAQSGIAAAPSAGMTKMAGGGIVAFANGGTVTPAEARRRLREIAPNWYDPSGRSDAQVMQDLKQFEGGTYRTREQQKEMFGIEEPTREEVSTRVADLNAAIMGSGKYGQGYQEPITTALEPEVDIGLPIPESGDRPALDLRSDTGPASPVPKWATDWMEQQKAAEQPKAPAAPEGGIPQALPQQAPDELADLRRATREGIMGQIKGDPEKERREALKQFLIGAGGKTSLAGALAGGSQAARRYETGQEAQRAKGLELGQSELGTASKERIADLDREAYININKESSLNKKIEMANDLQKSREKAIFDFYEEMYNLSAMSAAQGDAEAQNAVDQVKAQRDSEIQAAREKFKKEVDLLRAGAPLTAPSAPGNWGGVKVKTK